MKLILSIYIQPYSYSSLHFSLPLRNNTIFLNENRFVNRNFQKKIEAVGGNFVPQETAIYILHSRYTPSVSNSKKYPIVRKE